MPSSRLIAISAAACCLAGGARAFSGDATFPYKPHAIEGWSVLVHEKLTTDQKAETDKALGLLQEQLAAIVKTVPAPAVAKLREVTLWFSPAYEGIGPQAEYHPDQGWLVVHHREPKMAKGVEFTNVSNYEAETKRMPNFPLHELAHAFHDRVLGFDQPEIVAAYEKAKAAKFYDSVERWHGDGRPNTKERAYAMVNHKEYFAECSEAFFFRNDFQPFTREELRQHDPDMEKLLERLWNSPAAAPFEVTAPPAKLHAPPFYTKSISANGYPIVASGKVDDYALKEAAYLVNLMLAKRPDVREAMIKSGSRMSIMAHDEFTTELPEWDRLKPKEFWDARARGLGGSQTDPYCSCAEENLLAFDGDPYSKENILIHEFAHNIHLRGVVNVDPTFDQRLKDAYDKAMAQGLWKGKYAATNHHEYFAEGVQSWFDNNRPPDHDHNHVDTRAELIEYDPALAGLCREVFGETQLVYTNPKTRLRDHLAGYDPTKAPKFEWPERLKKSNEEIRGQARARSKAAEEAQQGAEKKNAPAAKSK